MPGEPPEEGCWLWPLAPEGFGYGQINYGGHHVRVHVFSYRLHNGPIPKGKIVRHTCDIPLCAHPRHLILGTRIDNMDDMRERGRDNRKGQAKVTEDEVREIRILVAEGATHQSVADQYGISRRAVGHMVRRTTWVDVL